MLKLQIYGHLQDCACTNSGRGSNLTLNGTVECDASIMLGTGAFGAVGALAGAHDLDEQCMHEACHEASTHAW